METQTSQPKISFGIVQWINDTPQAIKQVYRAIMFASGLFILIQGQFSIPPATIAEVNKWLGFGNILIYFVCQFFGIPKPGEQPDNIPPGHG